MSLTAMVMMKANWVMFVGTEVHDLWRPAINTVILQFLCSLKSAKLGVYANQTRGSPACCGARGVPSMQTVPSKQKAGTGPEIPISLQVHLHGLLPACRLSRVALLWRPLCAIKMSAWKSSSMAMCSRCSLPSVFYLYICGRNSTGRADGSKTSISLNEKCSETNLLLIFRLSWDKYIVAITHFLEAPCRGACKIRNLRKNWTCGGLDQGDPELLSNLYPSMNYVFCAAV